MDVTVVTLYFDLSIRESGMTRRAYPSLSEHLLSLPINLFIVADPEVTVHIWKRRRDLGLLPKTFIYPLNLEDGPYYRHRSAIEKDFIAGRKPVGLSSVKDSASYFTVGWTKFWSLKQALYLNPFSTENFAWVDYGLFHLWPGQEGQKQKDLLQDLMRLPQAKVRLKVITETHHSEFVDRKQYYSNRQCKVISGYFGGGKDVLSWLIKEFDKELVVCLDSGYPNLEEAILAVIYTNHRERFSVSYGDYQDLLNSGLPNLIVLNSNIRHCRHHGLWFCGIDMYQQLLPAINDYETLPPDINLLTLLDEMLIAGWYADDKDTSLAAAKLVLRFFTEHPQFRKLVAIDNYRNNLAFHDLSLD